jgi:hypothetical protein
MKKSLNHCEENKIYNEKTERCVLKGGKIGRNILKSKGECFEDNKVFNVKTNRCVLKSGRIGKKILETYKSPKRTPKRTPLKKKLKKSSRKSVSKTVRTPIRSSKKSSPKKVISSRKSKRTTPKRATPKRTTPKRSTPKRATPKRATPVRSLKSSLKKSTKSKLSRKSVKIISPKKVISPLKSSSKKSISRRSFISSTKSGIKKIILPKNLRSDYSNEFTEISGSRQEDMASILFIAKRYDNVCTSLPSNFNEMKKMLREDFGIVFIADKGKEDIMVRFDLFPKIIKCKKRFFLIPMNIKTHDKEGNIKTSHANFLIFDLYEKSLERFEPIGIDDTLVKKKHDDGIFKMFQTYCGKDENGEDRLLKYYPPSSFCPKLGPQWQDRYEEIHIKNKLSGDPIGFCAAWTIWYVNLRLLNPDIDRKSVLSESSILITEEFVSFRDFIRNYSKFITDYTNKLYETEDLSLTYREMKKYHV